MFKESAKSSILKSLSLSFLLIRDVRFSNKISSCVLLTLMLGLLIISFRYLEIMYSFEEIIFLIFNSNSLVLNGLLMYSIAPDLSPAKFLDSISL